MILGRCEHVCDATLWHARELDIRRGDELGTVYFASPEMPD